MKNFWQVLEYIWIQIKSALLKSIDLVQGIQPDIRSALIGAFVALFVAYSLVKAELAYSEE